MRILKVFAIIIALIAGVNFGLPVFFHFYRPLPALAAGISSPGVRDVEAEFELNRRLNQRFPIGSADAILKAEFDREGWGPVYTDDDFNRSQQPWRYVQFKRAISVMFVEVATVLWKSDEQGNLTEIKGHYFRDPFFK